MTALAHSRRRASLPPAADDRARVALNRRSGGRGGMRRGGGGSDPLAAAEASINSVAGLVINLDARDLPLGAVTHWIDRKNGYDFAGTATRDAAINGYPTVTGNGISDILTSTAAITHLAGVQAITVFMAYKATAAAVATHGVVGSDAAAADRLSFYTFNASVIENYSKGNIGSTQGKYVDALTTPTVLSTRTDFSLITDEVVFLRKNGTAQVLTRSTNSNNGGTFTAQKWALLGFTTGGVPSAFCNGSLGKVLVYSGAIAAGDITSIERALGLLTGILVA